MQIEAGATRARNEASLGYGQSQEDYKNRVLQMLLGGQGDAGGMMAGVIGQQGMVGSSLIGQIGTSLGNYADVVAARRQTATTTTPGGAGTAASAVAARTGTARTQDYLSPPEGLDLENLDLYPYEGRLPGSRWRKRRGIASSVTSLAYRGKWGSQQPLLPAVR
jgi:hypothetical protein